MNPNFSALLRFWPVVVALIGLLAMGVETRVNVSRLMERETAEQRQWQVIGEIKERVTAVETELRVRDGRP